MKKHSKRKSKQNKTNNFEKTKMIMKELHPHIHYTGSKYTKEEMEVKSEAFYHWCDTRRSIREFSNEPVPQKVLENIIKSASTAPSGANKQPWTFCLISNSVLKSKLRSLAEEEEKKSYGGRMNDEWLQDLEPLGTNWEKPFIDIAPWIIVVMKKSYDMDEQGNRHQNYYVSESVGIACGFLLAAIHNAGLVALTHTPSPMNFISKALNRPENEKPFLLIPVGLPAENATVPNIKRKELEEIVVYYT